MEFLNELGAESAEISNGQELSGKELMREYQSLLNEAARFGNTEREMYYRAKLNTLEREMAVNETLKDSYGSSPFPEIKRHQDAAMSYERKANELERKIQRGQEPQKRMQEVNDLRRRAKREKDAMESAKRYYKSRLSEDALGTYQGMTTPTGHQGEVSELLGSHPIPTGHQGKAADELGTYQGMTTPTDHQGVEISFSGGLGASQIEHIRGSQMISEANQKRSSAASYESDARRARNAGDISRANELESKANSLISEARSLESKGKSLMKK